jgi:hypothetical protein
MKNIIIFALIFALVSCSEKKQNDKNERIKENTTGKIPTIEFDEEMHDFGLIKAGEILTFSFEFTNRGEADLKINKVETDCGCIEADIVKSCVTPGEKGIIEVKFNSSGLFGKQLKTVEIQSNCKETKHLIIFAEVENEQIEFRN